MQEEVNQKTMALSIRASKLTGKVLAAAFSKVVRAAKAHHQKALTPKGRQSVKKLMNHYGAKNSMPYVGAPKDFDRIAKEFHVDYAFHKVSPGLAKKHVVAGAYLVEGDVHMIFLCNPGKVLRGSHLGPVSFTHLTLQTGYSV